VRKAVAFALLVAGSIGLAGGYVGWKASSASRASTPVAAGAAAKVASGERIVFQNVNRDNGYAQVSSVPLSNPSGKRRLSGLVCERIHYSAGRGICLLPRQNVLGRTYDAILLDSRLRRRHRVQLPGINSRARISPDGRYAAATGFVSGDSYADHSFSTRTFILDLKRGKKLANLEDFAVYRDGARFQSVDFNFWGVTFARDGQFYATLRTRGRTYLVRGDVAAARLDVLREGVECPSLSPDGMRIAFKKRVGDGNWRLSVLSLDTLEDRALAETRSVDDQAEWLNDDEILYGLDSSVWTVRADGSGAPRMLIRDALSPAVPVDGSERLKAR
jgi:dipeptidyl aminopeptidase/acylaminoacyl peptidase